MLRFRYAFSYIKKPVPVPTAQTGIYMHPFWFQISRDRKNVMLPENLEFLNWSVFFEISK